MIKTSTCVYCKKPIRWVMGSNGYRIWTHVNHGNMRCDGVSFKKDREGFELSNRAVPKSFNTYLNRLKNG